MPLVAGQLVGKYKKLLIPFAGLSEEAQRLAPRLQELRRGHREKKLGDAECVELAIRLFLELRSGSTWPLIRGLPSMVPETLAAWRQGKINLRLAERALPARTILAAQAEGFRFVTLAWDAAIAGTPVENTRDACEFALHDLGHAYTFFKADYDARGQAAFFRALLLDLEKLEPFCARDNKFRVALEYLMSDMNSHPEHLRQYLQGIIVEMFLRFAETANATTRVSDANALLGQLECLRRRPRIFASTPAE